MLPLRTHLVGVITHKKKTIGEEHMCPRTNHHAPMTMCRHGWAWVCEHSSWMFHFPIVDIPVVDREHIRCEVGLVSMRCQYE